MNITQRGDDNAKNDPNSIFELFQEEYELTWRGGDCRPGNFLVENIEPDLYLMSCFFANDTLTKHCRNTEVRDIMQDHDLMGEGNNDNDQETGVNIIRGMFANILKDILREMLV